MLELRGGRRTPSIQQNEASECALACLTMVACHHGYHADLGTLRQRYSISLKGATLKQLMSMAETLGFSVRPVRGDLSDLQHLELPAILHWDLNHYVVLARIERRLGRARYHVHDPAKGVVKLTVDDVSRHWTGVALELVKSQGFRPKMERAPFRLTQLWSSMSGFWRTAGSVLALSLLLQLAALASPFYLQIAIDTVAPSGDADLLLVLAIGFGGLAMLNLVMTWLRTLVLIGLNSTLSYQIVVNLFHHLTRLPLSWFEKRHVGDIISRFGSTLPVTQLLSEGMVAAFIDGLMALLTLALMFLYSPLLCGVVLVTAVVYLVIRIAFLHGMRLANVDAITATARENSLFIESIRGISAIKAFGQEGNRQRLWQRAKANAVNADIRLRRLTAGFDAAGQSVLAVEQVAFVFLAVSLALKGDLTIGMIFAFQAYKQQFLDASVRLTEQWMNYKVLQVHLGRLSDIALSRTEDEGRRTSGESPDFTGGIELRRVTFRYASSDPDILKCVDLRIRYGEMVAFVGPSGGGKTTLLKVMMGLFEPTTGHVLVGGRSLTSFDRSMLRARIGYVAQDDMLYAGSLAENIAFFDPDIDMDRVVEVARLAAIDEDIRRMPLRYDSLVGDMGSALSGGQKQRILLARALYGDPDILFMDEGTANLDPVSEEKVLQSLLGLTITRIIVAHRPMLSDASDHVVLVDNGISLSIASKPNGKSKYEEKGEGNIF